LDKNRYGAIRKETDILKKLATHHITYVPQLIDSGDGWFSYTWIDGESFDKVFPHQDLATQHRLIHEFLDKAYELDKLGIIHGELDRPMSNILVHTEKLANNEPCISFIDFERGYWQDFSGKNLRHALQRVQRLGYVSAEECKAWGQLPADTIYANAQYALTTNPAPKKSFPNSMTWVTVLSIIGIILDQLSKYVFYNLQR
jgi:predicted Ser/Thr protein kinase